MFDKTVKPRDFGNREYLTKGTFKHKVVLMLTLFKFKFRV